MIKILYTIIAVFLNSLCFTQDEMTLQKAISIGIENNYGIKINDLNIQIAENNNTWAMAGRGPIVDLNINFSNNLTKDNNKASFLQGTYYTGSFGPSLNAQWIVFNGGRIRVQKDQLSQFTDQQRLAKDNEIHALVTNIHQAYYTVIFRKAQLEVLQNNLELSNDRLEYEKTKKEFGSSNSYNLLQFETSIISDTSAILSQHQAVEVAKRQLLDIMNEVGMPNYSFSETLSVKLEEIDEQQLEEILSEENYTLKTLEMIANLNRINTRIEKSSKKPTISLNSSFGFTQAGFNSNEINFRTQEPFGFISSNRWDGNLTASLSWNLIDGGVRKTKIENAQLQEEVDQLTVLEAKATLTNQLAILISNYKNQKDLLTLSNQRLEVSQRNLAMTEERFKAGVITSLDYRNVQIQMLSAAFAKATAIYNLIVTKSEIDFMVGRYN
tara:strand:+ start:1099 stop:2418 length:1320 start_codon:yes stop_codon:yes gene_type:complete